MLHIDNETLVNMFQIVLKLFLIMDLHLKIFIWALILLYVTLQYVMLKSTTYTDPPLISYHSVKHPCY